MNPDKNDETDVPAGWELCISKKNSNRKYYFNRKTGESSWCKPQAIISPQGNIKTKKNKEECKSSGKAIKDEIKKILKRKSDGYYNHGNSMCKKSKEDKQSPETPYTISPAKKRVSTSSIHDSSKYTSKGFKSVERTHSPPKKSPKPSPSPAKRPKEVAISSRNSTDQSPKPASSKNTANARLSQLRADLSAEVKKQEAKEPKTSTPTAKPTPEKAQRQETTTNETLNNSQSHSPNESAQSVISPSQFFAANKILCSMKAQLPDRDTLKPKDAFADIEKGINNQTTEYPFMKHPATPPQFTEASKLISAINSKLSYRKDPPVETLVNIFKSAEQLNNAETPTSVYNVFKSADSLVNTNTYKFAEMPVMSRAVETPVSSFGSAKERMDTLKSRLSNEAMDTQADSNTAIVDMDVDTKETNHVVEPKIEPGMNKQVTSNENVILVVDTNIFIHELDFIKNVMNSHIEGYKEQPTLMVPWRVVNELDKLKDSNNGNGAICKRARPAMDYLYKSLPDNDNRIKVQPLREANSHIFPCETPDDEILNCCFQQSERGNPVILLSNDKNLCTKAVANGVQTKQLRALVLKPNHQTTTKPLSTARLKRPIYKLLSNILENEMRAKYDKMWQHVIFKPPPWKLSDVLMCLLKHWIAVFNEVFPRIEYLIMDLKNTLGVIESKGPATITQAEVSNFKDMCLEVAKRCQIIPEYMELAKTTVERLESGSPSDSDDENEIDEIAVIEAFEGIWTVFSSYCAKLASAVGVEHTVEDKLPGSDSVDELTSRLSLFERHISTLAGNMEAVLNVAANSPLFMENVARLEHVLKCCQNELGLKNKINNASLRIFCFKCRIMLQEAQGKFCELMKLINICKNNLQMLTNMGKIAPGL